MKRKEEGARGHIFLTAKYSYAYVHIRHLSENRSGHPQYYQNISEAKYIGTSREQFHVLFILKKSFILNFENPLLIATFVLSTPNRSVSQHGG